MPRTARTTGRIRALALATVVLAVAIGPLQSRSQNASAAPLTAGTDFTITSTISRSATSASQPGVLYPGVARYLWYTVSNPLPQPITVTSLGIARAEAPAACPLANLELGDPTFTGALAVPARGTRTVPTPRPILLKNLPVNQDGCKNVTFRFTYTGTGWYSASPPPTTRKVRTSTVLALTPNPALSGTPVTVTARVVAMGGSDRERATGTVTFHLVTPTGTTRIVGRGAVGPDGTARLRVSTLPAGSAALHATYGGSATLEPSTSQPAMVSVIAPPPQCTAAYATSILGRPDAPVITGTRGNDFIYAVGGNFRIKSGRGSDCIVVGDGDNVISDGSGADVVIAGNGTNRITLVGSGNTLLIGDGNGNRVTVKGTKKGTKVRKTHRNVVSVGDGAGNRITVRKGSKNVVAVGDGTANRITVRKGNRNTLTAGDGAANRITIRAGKRNAVKIGNGTMNRVKVGKGAKNRVWVGDGGRNKVTVKGTKARVLLGRGTGNRVVARAGGKGRATCSVPAPPSSWSGKPARYYRDTLLRCRVVTR